NTAAHSPCPSVERTSRDDDRPTARRDKCHHCACFQTSATVRALARLAADTSQFASPSVTYLPVSDAVDPHATSTGTPTTRVNSSCAPTRSARRRRRRLHRYPPNLLPCLEAMMKLGFLQPSRRWCAANTKRFNSR